MDGKLFVVALALTLSCMAQGIDGRTLFQDGYYQPPQGQVQQLQLSQYEPPQQLQSQVQLRFPADDDEEVIPASGNLANEVGPEIPENGSLPDAAAQTEDEDEDSDIDAKILANIDVNNLTPEQKQVYDELVGLAEEEDSGTQGRTFGLFKLKFNLLWNKFKSLFGPKYFELYAGAPQVYGSQGVGQGQAHGFEGDDFKKRNEPNTVVIGGGPASNYERESPIFQIPFVGPLTKFITRTIPKYFDSFQQQPYAYSFRDNYGRSVNSFFDDQDQDRSSFEYRTFDHNV